MSSKSTQEKNPVAKLRDKFFEKKKNRSPSNEIKDTLKKDKKPSDQKDDANKKVARPRTPRNEAEL